MNVKILDIKKLPDRISYEVFMEVDGVNCASKLTFVEGLKIWDADHRFWLCLKGGVGMAPKHVVGVVSNFQKGKTVQFPVDLGDF